MNFTIRGVLACFHNTDDFISDFCIPVKLGKNMLKFKLRLAKDSPQHVKVDFSKKLKKLGPKQKTIQTFNIDAQGFRKQKMKIL